jgi:glutamate/aspartate transport system substrate-binding protein
MRKTRMPHSKILIPIFILFLVSPLPNGILPAPSPMHLTTPRRLRALALSIALLAIALPSLAAGDTLERIRTGKVIVLGVREAAFPFSYLDEHKKPVGYAVDLCLRAVEEVRRELKLPDLKVEYKLVTGPERIPKLVKGEIDLECGSTTNTKARQEQVAFSYSYFVASMRVLASKNRRIESIKDLDGLDIALSKGTTSEKLFNQLIGGELRATSHVYSNNAEAYEALKAGKVQAFPQDDSLLTGLAYKDHATDVLGVSSMALSVEPYGVMVRKDDRALLALVDRSLARTFSSGDIYPLYAKWFNSDAMKIALGRLTLDSFRRPNKEPGLAIVLGYSI